MTSNSTFPLSRSEVDHNVDQAPPKGSDLKAVRERVRKIIESGNRLVPNPKETSQDLASQPSIDKDREPNRKALIIAPVYKETDERRKELSLPATARDVLLVHEMLTEEAGYEIGEIRVLSDVCGGFYGTADPTRENVIASLQWLVHDSCRGDFRFLHFSGHGARDEKDSDDDGTRKVARMVHPTVNQNTYTGVPLDDYEDSIDLVRRRIRDGERPKRLRVQKIPKQVKYYKQAIMTRLGESRDDEESQDPSVIWDTELNHYLSQLHPESTITCVIDCCASGRMLNLPDKALGPGFRGNIPDKDEAPGFRGRLQAAVGQGKLLPPEAVLLGGFQNIHLGQVNQNADVGLLVQGLEQTPIPEPAAPIPDLQPIAPIPEPELDTEILGTASPASESAAMVSESSSDESTEQPSELFNNAGFWVEELPEGEKQLNKIRANIFHWSACHLRQNAHNSASGPCATGELTRAFTKTYKELRLANTHTHKQIYKEVKREVHQTTTSWADPRPQFVQLWTAFKDEDPQLRASQSFSACQREAIITHIISRNKF